MGYCTQGLESGLLAHLLECSEMKAWHTFGERLEGVQAPFERVAVRLDRDPAICARRLPRVAGLEPCDRRDACGRAERCTRSPGPRRQRGLSRLDIADLAAGVGLSQFSHRSDRRRDLADCRVARARSAGRVGGPASVRSSAPVWSRRSDYDGAWDRRCRGFRVCSHQLSDAAS